MAEISATISNINDYKLFKIFPISKVVLNLKSFFYAEHTGGDITYTFNHFSSNSDFAIEPITRKNDFGNDRTVGYKVSGTLYIAENDLSESDYTEPNTEGIKQTYETLRSKIISTNRSWYIQTMELYFEAHQDQQAGGKMKITLSNVEISVSVKNTSNINELIIKFGSVLPATSTDLNFTQTT